MYKYLNALEVRNLNRMLYCVLNLKLNIHKPIYNSFYNEKISFDEAINLYYKMILEEFQKNTTYLNIDKRMSCIINEKKIINTEVETNNYNLSLNSFLDCVEMCDFVNILIEFTTKFEIQFSDTLLSELNPYINTDINEDFKDLSEMLKELIDNYSNDQLEDLDIENTEEFLQSFREDYFENFNGNGYVIYLKNFKLTDRGKEVLLYELSINEYEDFFAGEIYEEFKYNQYNTYITIPSSLYEYDGLNLRVFNILFIELYLHVKYNYFQKKQI